MLEIRKGYTTENKTFRLPIEVIEQLNTLAQKNNLSLNQLVTQCLQYALSNIKEEPNNKYD